VGERLQEGVSRNVLVSGNIVVLEAIFHGINTGEFMGLPPTGRQVSVPMMMIYEIEDGLIQSVRLYMDGATMMRQLGHIE
jgi:predicted ester cyclase